MKRGIKVGRSQGCDIKSDLQEVYYENLTEMKEGFFFIIMVKKKKPPPKKNPKTQTCCFNLNICNSDWA